jgi:glycosyltransferase involved in cell wall biosynthesis
VKRVLYIAYYWPPCGGISVVRNLKFTKYLRDFGWEPIVYAPQNASYSIMDESTFNDLPKDIKILRTPIFEPYKLFNLVKGKKTTEGVKDVFLVTDKKPSLAHKLGVWIRGNFFIPDARAAWIKPSIKYLRNYVKQNPVDAIISYGPPHSMHLIAQQLHAEFGIPWLSDWQDPWTEIDYFEKFYLMPTSRAKHKRLEKEVITQADALVMVSKSWVTDLQKLSCRKVHYIPFGYDEDDFNKVKPAPQTHFTISHFGMLGIDRNPEVLWQALAQLVIELPAFAQSLQIKLSGHVDARVFEAIKTHGLHSHLKYQQHINKNELFDHVRQSSVLLVLINKPDPNINYNNKGRIPAKLFECLGAQKPILVIGPTDGDVANIVAETQTGITIDYENITLAKSTIMQWYNAWQKRTVAIESKNIEQYTFKNLTGKLAHVLNEISHS